MHLQFPRSNQNALINGIWLVLKLVWLFKTQSRPRYQCFANVCLRQFEWSQNSDLCMSTAKMRKWNGFTASLKTISGSYDHAPLSLIAWEPNHQRIRSHIWKSLLINLDFSHASASKLTSISLSTVTLHKTGVCQFCFFFTRIFIILSIHCNDPLCNWPLQQEIRCNTNVYSSTNCVTLAVGTHMARRILSKKIYSSAF